jgi:CBS domain-containing protein
METVQRILDEKGHDVYAVSPDTLVYDALELMRDKDIGALLVLEKGKIAGIFSERDYARKVILQGKSSLNTTVREIMTEHVIFASPHQTNEQCMALMTARHVRHLPILDQGELVGMISIGDLVRSIINEQKDTIIQLEHYILQYTSIT